MSRKPYRIALVGLGKIARDQHIPCIQGNPRFALAATASTSGAAVQGAPAFASLGEVLAKGPEVDAVALLTPPDVRTALALEAIAAGKHVLLEKPPAGSMADFNAMREAASRQGVTLFATWHSRFNAAVDEARRRLAGRRLAELAIIWKEDVRRWHPGQEWIWTKEGFGVLDPGINAFSIATAILEAPLSVTGAELSFPENRASPIAAEIRFASEAHPGAMLSANLDWRQEGEQTWTIQIATADGEAMALTAGGTRLTVAGHVVVDQPSEEYERIYERFAALLDEGAGDADGAPLRLALDALAKGERRTVAAFDW